MRLLALTLAALLLAGCGASEAKRAEPETVAHHGALIDGETYVPAAGQDKLKQYQQEGAECVSRSVDAGTKVSIKDAAGKQVGLSKLDATGVVIKDPDSPEGFACYIEWASVDVAESESYEVQVGELDPQVVRGSDIGNVAIPLAR